MSVEGAVSGWGTTPTDTSSHARGGGGGGPSAAKRLAAVAGCRRIALYVILACLMFIIFLNIGLTLWILTVLRFSVDGIGPIRIVQGGIQLSGRARVMDELVTSSIESRVGQPISLHSYRNFTVQVRQPDGQVDSQLVIKRSGMEVLARTLHIRDSLGRAVFSAEAGEVRLGADALSLAGAGGVSFSSSVQTPLVRADAGHDLVLESPTRTLEVKAPHSINLESRAGGITANSLKDISLVSMAGSVQLDASNIYIYNLTTAKFSQSPQPLPRYKRSIYQLCACADGKLFLAPPDGLCQTHDQDDVCR